MLIVRGLLEGLYGLSKGLADVIYKCTTCGFCNYRCALDNVELIEGFRADLVDAGFAPLEHELMAKWAVEHRNPYYKRAARAEERGSWAIDIPFKAKSDELLFVGCTPSFIRKSAAKAAAVALVKAGVELAYLGVEEGCCGSWMHRTGRLPLFEEHAKYNVKMFQDVEVRRLITICAGCYRTLKADYPKHIDRFDVEVLHVVQLFAKLIDEGRISFKRKVKMSVTYHDPCHLSRHMRVIEEPRAILEGIPGVTFIETRFNKYEARCCGAGGGLLSAFPNLASSIAIRRLKELEETDANAIVTACPFCEIAISKAVEQSGSRMKVYDLAELIVEAMG